MVERLYPEPHIRGRRHLGTPSETAALPASIFRLRTMLLSSPAVEITQQLRVLFGGHRRDERLEAAFVTVGEQFVHHRTIDRTTMDCRFGRAHHFDTGAVFEHERFRTVHSTRWAASTVRAATGR
jgi:hypothetical protein